MADEAVTSEKPDDAALRARPFAARFRMYLAERYPIGPGILLAVLFGGTCDLVGQVQLLLSKWDRLIPAVHLGRTTSVLGHAFHGVAWIFATPPVDVRHRADAATAAICALVFLTFLLLRVFDEFKDFEEDRLAHPERIVQRGIVTLRELRMVAAAVIAAIVGLAALLGDTALVMWIAVVAYAGLMAKEFFHGAALRRSMLVYALSHQVIVPLTAVACLASSSGWIAFDPTTAALCVTVAGLGLGFEVGRKINAPGQEDPHDESYSQAWGSRAACGVALGALLVAAIAGVFLTKALSFSGEAPGAVPPLELSQTVIPSWCAIVIGVGWILAALGFAGFLKAPSPKTSKSLQGAAALASLFTYGGLIAGIIAAHGLRFGS